MRIGIIGQPCIDEILHPGDRTAKLALGGVLYSYAAMERMMDRSGDTFLPLTWLSAPDVPILNPLLTRFTHLDRTSGLWKTESLTNRVQLVYADDGSRVEHCPIILPELTESQLTPKLLSSLDGLFVNMISGFDISIETLETSLRESNPRPYVHLDIHALVLGSLSERSDEAEGYGGGRQPRGVKDWQRWLDVADSIQLTEFEARWLGDPEIRSEEELLEYLERQLASAHADHSDLPRLTHLILTRGARGVSMYEIQTGKVHHEMPPAVTPVDTTGAGDVFGSVFTYSILRGKSPVESLEEAVKIATWCTTLRTIDEILTSPISI